MKHGLNPVSEAELAQRRRDAKNFSESMADIFWTGPVPASCFGFAPLRLCARHSGSPRSSDRTQKRSDRSAFAPVFHLCSIRGPKSLASALLALGRMGIPGVAGLRLDVGMAGARRRIGNADEDLAGRALNLPAGVAWIAFQRLVAVGTVEFEFVHGLHSLMRKTSAKSM